MTDLFPHHRSSRAGKVIRGSLALLWILVAGGLTVSVTGAAVLRAHRPQMALAMAPFDARAKALFAGHQLASNTAGRSAGAAAELSREALMRDATVVSAWRNLALAEGVAGRPAGARRLFELSERLSRRDAVTQLWLIEEAVQRNDIRRALRHYDIALRTSPSLAESLAPILVNATSYDAILPELARFVATDPPWAGEYFRYLAGMLPSADAAAALLTRLPASVRARHMDRLRMLVPRAIEEREYRAAWRIYEILKGRATDPLLRDGTFTRASTFPPFEWELIDGSEVRAEQVGGGVNNAGLRVSASSGAVNTAARQLLVLSPGTYRIRSISEIGETSRPDRLTWQIRCIGSNSNLSVLDVSPRRPGQNHSARDFRVPTSGCDAQWLSLEISAPEAPGGVEAWIRRVDIDSGAARNRGA